MNSSSLQETSNSKAIVGAVKFFAALIIVGSVLYSEILFLGIISVLFPAGILLVGASIGAVTTGMSILVLCLGKSHWFRPGYQLIAAWTFTLVEVAILIMNDVLSYAIHSHATDSWLLTWKSICPAAPVFSLVGWILIFYFDPQRAIRHKQMEMVDTVAKAQIDFESMMHEKAMAMQRKAAAMVEAQLEKNIETKILPFIEQAATKFTAKIASQLTGEQVSSAQVIEGRIETLQIAPLIESAMLAQESVVKDQPGLFVENKTPEVLPTEPLPKPFQGFTKPLKSVKEPLAVKPSKPDRYTSPYADLIEKVYASNPEITVMEIVNQVGCSRPTAEKWLSRVRTK